jgi:tetratricopeptide (TPR) repeat protein
MWRATGISGNDADRLYEQADKKFAQALKIVPNDEEICASRVEAKRRRGLLHPDEAGRRLLTETCEMCEARVGIYAKGTFDAWILNTWGLALRDLAARETGAEADRLCEIAAEKLRQGYSLAPDQNQILSSRAEVLLWRASLHTGAQQREILGRVLEICEQLASQGSGGAGILQLWGDALSWLATSASASEAESLYTRADEKYARALSLASSNRQASISRVRAAGRRALLKRGRERLDLLTQAREQCVDMAGWNSQDPELWEEWGTLLSWMAVFADERDGDRLFAEASEKIQHGLNISPGHPRLTCGLAGTLLFRASLHGSDGGAISAARASELFETVLQKNPTDSAALYQWATAVSLHARLEPGSEAIRSLADAAAKLEAAVALPGVNQSYILIAWANLLVEQWNASGRREPSLIDAAKQKLAEAESLVPGSTPYFLARLYGEIGDADQCRVWLEKSGEPGRQMGSVLVEKQPEFASVRNCDWFQALLETQPGKVQ